MDKLKERFRNDPVFAVTVLAVGAITTAVVLSKITSSSAEFLTALKTVPETPIQFR